MHPLAQKLAAHIWQKQLIQAGDRVAVAVSGGCDSVALFRLLVELRSELGMVLSVAHFNHKLRGAESDADEVFVKELATLHKLEFYSGAEDVRGFAAENQLSLEAAARELRYKFFRQLLTDKVDRVATAHTMDDQAETVMMRVIRGTGLQGLGAIRPKIKIENLASTIVRPLLQMRRDELNDYLQAIGQTWCEDSTNLDLHFTRNRVRQTLIPLLKDEFNPSITQRLSEISEIAREEEEFWAREIERVSREIVSRQSDDGFVIGVPAFCAQPLAMQRRLIHSLAARCGASLEFKHIEKILDGARDIKGRVEVGLPDGWKIVREKNELIFSQVLNTRPSSGSQIQSSDESDSYEYVLPVPGTVTIRETGTVLEVIQILTGDSLQGYNPQNLFDAQLLGTNLRVRNWRAGDRFWPAHTKCSKKVKELLQERHIHGPARRLWPVVERISSQSETEIVWVQGFLPPAHLQLKNGNVGAVYIRELASNNSAKS